MPSADYIEFHHATALLSADRVAPPHSITPPPAGAGNFTIFVPSTATTASKDYNACVYGVQGHTDPLNLVQFDAQSMNILLIAWADAQAANSLRISDSTWLYNYLFKPERSQHHRVLSLWVGEQRSRPQKADISLVKPSPALKSTVVEKFNKLAADWRKTRNPIGSVADLCTNFSYQQIIGLGQSAVPLILRELERSLDHWFWALSAITSASPVRSEHEGRLKMMAQDWFLWAKQKGYQW